MLKHISLFLALSVALLCAETQSGMDAQSRIVVGSPPLRPDQRGDPLSTAVDAKGVRHRGSDYVGPVPWMTDAIKKRRPNYPYELRARGFPGRVVAPRARSGLFRVTLDVTTGSVSKVAMIQSTGAAALDENAMKALRQWQWKPGKWKEIDVPITFAGR
jgi:TonB family protein